jgi:phosphoribosyl 1,2-cyclic phosphate phosphodiesterase
LGGKLTILGCGSSAGVPAIGNYWGACDPNDPRNMRTRPSISLQTEKTLIIVDTGPDFREQLNRENLGCPDAIIITHEHADHVNGIDELRTLQRRNDMRKFPMYSIPKTLDGLRARLSYMFEETENGFYPAVCEPIVLDMNKPITIGDITLTPFLQDHGTLDSIGLRVGNIGYSTDVKRLDDAAFQTLQGIETWIVDAAGYHSDTNPVHANLKEVYAMNERIGAQTVILTHLPPTMDYKTLMKELPEEYFPAIDGMAISLTS